MTTVFSNTAVWTGGPDPAVYGHVVVEDGRIVTTAAGAYRGRTASADVVDLAGGCLLPAFGDGHVHPVFGALERRGPQIRAAQTVNEVVDAVRAYAETNTQDAWILGASYSPTLTAHGMFDAAWLDRAVSDRPVVLRATDYHTVWCNTEALRRAGISASTPDPPLGRIVRRADGAPCGTLREWDACDLVLRLTPPRTSTELRQAVAQAGRICASMGLTWVMDAWVDVEAGLMDAYLDEAATGDLPVRFDLALRADPRGWREQHSDFIAHRQRASAASPDGHLRVNTVKFFTDGIVESGTALLLEDYCDCPHDRGLAVWDPAELRAAVAAFDLDGFQVHLHAIGDGGVRLALDAVEHARRANPLWDRRPVVCHVQLVDEQDLPRFAALGVIANFQPYWAHYDDFQSQLTIPRLGKRSNGQYPMADMLRSGARMSFGTDWPVSTLHPMAGVSVAVNRTVGGGSSWLPEQCLTIPQALRACTAGVAFQAGAERFRGSIAPGMVADLVWISENPFTVAESDLGSIDIKGTWLAGRRTY